MRVVAWVSLLSGNPMLEKWFIMQCIKEGSTLRVSPKKQALSKNCLQVWKTRLNGLKSS
jgi:hypothetical protein